MASSAMALHVPTSATLRGVRASTPLPGGRKLRVAVIGGGPSGSSAAEALASGGVETFLFERAPTAAKPCGGAIPPCMLDEFQIPDHLVDRRVTKMKIFSPSNISADFGRTLLPGESIAMLRREALDSFLRSRAKSAGANLIPSLVTRIDAPPPSDPTSPYLIHYLSSSEGNATATLSADVVVGADGAHSRVAAAIGAGGYGCAIAFQERIRLPEEKMAYYTETAEMYLGSDVSPDFYGWVFPKWDHVAVGTGTVRGKREIKRLQRGMRERAGGKIGGGRVVKMEAHPIPEHPRAVRVKGRAALVGDAAGYVTKCAGEGIYFAAKSGRVCGEGIVRASEGGSVAVAEGDLRREYLREWDAAYSATFKVMDVLQGAFYGSDAAREALVELCGDDYVQRVTFQSYLYKRLAHTNRWEDARLLLNTLGTLIRCRILARPANTDPLLSFSRL